MFRFIQTVWNGLFPPPQPRYTLWRAVKLGWDKDEMAATILEDAKALFQNSERYHTLSDALCNAYGAEDLRHAFALTVVLEDIAHALENDTTLPSDQRFSLARKIKSVYHVPFVSAGFALATRQPKDRRNASEVVRNTLIGLYLYGRTGNRFADDQQRQNVHSKLTEKLAHLHTAPHTNLRSALVASMDHADTVQDIGFCLKEIPEIMHVTKAVCSPEVLESILYALDLGVEYEAPADIGEVLFKQLK